MSTDIQNINFNLQKIYKEFKNDLIQIVDKKDLNSNYSAPLLMNINDQYLNSSLKVLFVGQETCGWGKDKTTPSDDDINLKDFLEGDKDYINELISKYDNFDFAKKHIRGRTPFWRFYRKLHNILNIPFNEHPNHIAWTNLFKFDYNAKALPIEQKEKFKLINGNLLRKEIDIIKPNIILFVTGYRYDNFIKECLSANYEPIKKGYLAQVNLNLNNQPIKAFRTSHPNYLNFKKRFDEVFDLIGKNSDNSEFTAKMKKSEEDVKAGRTTKIEPVDIWNLGTDENNRIPPKSAMVKRLGESRQQLKDGKVVAIPLEDIWK